MSPDSPGCRKTLKVSDVTMFGKKIRFPLCKAVVTMPRPKAPAPASTTPEMAPPETIPPRDAFEEAAFQDAAFEEIALEEQATVAISPSAPEKPAEQRLTEEETLIDLTEELAVKGTPSLRTRGTAPPTASFRGCLVVVMCAFLGVLCVVVTTGVGGAIGLAYSPQKTRSFDPTGTSIIPILGAILGGGCIGFVLGLVLVGAGVIAFVKVGAGVIAFVKRDRK